MKKGGQIKHNKSNIIGITYSITNQSTTSEVWREMANICSVALGDVIEAVPEVKNE
ncbi:hypothetical protein [Clostridium thermosuccinogenes]|uniref:hypothetical protein n=1 Tax=Clostridium thermosuccinogenes TaxID=84032 RepID=UPI00137470E4|nr:hypothetical protein [Pseudoclostridium thermosuccinogenes]